MHFRLIYNVAKPIETLVFQNLMPLGFKLQSRQVGLDKMHSLIVLQKLAQYHALSLILNERVSCRSVQLTVRSYPK